MKTGEKGKQEKWSVEGTIETGGWMGGGVDEVKGKERRGEKERRKESG